MLRGVRFAPTSATVYFASPPQNQASGIGQNVVFAAQANGSLPLSYQWQFDGTNLDDATNSSLALTDVSTNEAGNYTVVVTNNYGSVTSAVAVLSVGSPPVINPEPVSQTALLRTETAGSPPEPMRRLN